MKTYILKIQVRQSVSPLVHVLYLKGGSTRKAHTNLIVYRFNFFTVKTPYFFFRFCHIGASHERQRRRTVQRETTKH